MKEDQGAGGRYLQGGGCLALVQVRAPAAGILPSGVPAGALRSRLENQRQAEFRVAHPNGFHLRAAKRTKGQTSVSGIYREDPALAQTVRNFP